MTNDPKFCRHQIQWFSAIEHSISNNLVMPALALIYSGIDAVAWIAYGDISVSKRFTQFVEEHMYEEKKLLPRPIDLYAARCGVLHTLTPDSDLSKAGKATIVSYAWGNANLESLRSAGENLAPGQYTYLHLSDLFESYKLGFVHCMDSIESNEACQSRMKKHFSFTSKDAVDSVNQNGI
jgi:hypothetical protein